MVIVLKRSGFIVDIGEGVYLGSLGELVGDGSML